jgi:arylformamidase
MKIIDLSVLVNENTPVYPGDPKIKIQPAGVFEKDGWNDHVLTIGTHVGTHIDAPWHMIGDGKRLNEYNIDTFVGRGKYIAVEGEFSLETAQNAGIEEGDIVLFHTGMDAKYHEPEYFENFPAMSEEIATYLVEKKVKIVGLDTGSADNQDGFPIHKLLLAGNVLIIENLTNLGQLKDVNFTVYALPMNLDIDGAPTRVIAVVE